MTTASSPCTQGVLACPNPVDSKHALRNLGIWSRGALHVEAVTLEDDENDIVAA